MKKVILVALLFLFPIVCIAEEITTKQADNIIAGSTIQTASKESINDILTKAEHLGPAQYTQIYTYSVINKFRSVKPTISTIKIWYKEPFIKMEYTAQLGVRSEIIKHPNAAYLRLSKEGDSKGEYYKIANAPDPKTFEEIAKEIKDSSTLQILGSEVLDGKTTTLVQTDVPLAGGPEVTRKKFWIWNEKGIPLKIEYRTEMKNDILVLLFENKDFVFGDISDSVFEVPIDKVKEFAPTLSPK